MQLSVALALTSLTSPLILATSDAKVKTAEPWEIFGYSAKIRTAIAYNNETDTYYEVDFDLHVFDEITADGFSEENRRDLIEMCPPLAECSHLRGDQLLALSQFDYHRMIQDPTGKRYSTQQELCTDLNRIIKESPAYPTAFFEKVKAASGAYSS